MYAAVFAWETQVWLCFEQSVRSFGSFSALTPGLALSSRQRRASLAAQEAVEQSLEILRTVLAVREDQT